MDFTGPIQDWTYQHPNLYEKIGLSGPIHELNYWLKMGYGEKAVIVFIAYKIVKLADSSGYLQIRGHAEGLY